MGLNSDHSLELTDQPMPVQHHELVQLWGRAEVQQSMPVMQEVDHCSEVVLLFGATDLSRFLPEDVEGCALHSASFLFLQVFFKLQPPFMKIKQNSLKFNSDDNSDSGTPWYTEY